MIVACDDCSATEGGDLVSEDVYKVEGMTCAHCVAAVTDEVGRI